MSLDTLKRNSGLDKLLTAVQKDTAPVEKQSYVDERFWKPELDKTGNGYAVLRFLPAPDGEDKINIKSSAKSEYLMNQIIAAKIVIRSLLEL